jgi:hypothetical protein
MMKHRFLPFRNGKLLCEDSPRRTEERAMIAEKSDRESINEIDFAEKREKKRRDSLVSPKHANVIDLCSQYLKREGETGTTDNGYYL